MPLRPNRLLAPLLMAPLLLAAACGSPKAAMSDAPADPGQSPGPAQGSARAAAPDRPFALERGQTAALQGTDVQLTFVEVVSDSRCPANAKCVWAGEAKVRYDVVIDGTQHEVILPIPGGVYIGSENAHTPVDTLGHRFALLGLQPYPGDPEEEGMALTATTQVYVGASK